MSNTAVTMYKSRAQIKRDRITLACAVVVSLALFVAAAAIPAGAVLSAAGFAVTVAGVYTVGAVSLVVACVGIAAGLSA